MLHNSKLKQRAKRFKKKESKLKEDLEKFKEQATKYKTLYEQTAARRLLIERLVFGGLLLELLEVFLQFRLLLFEPFRALLELAVVQHGGEWWILLPVDCS